MSSVLSIAERTIRFRTQELQQIAEGEHDSHGDGQRQEGIDAQLGEQEIDGIAAQHDEGAMGEIDDVEHAPDQRHAERHQAVEPAEQDPVDEDLGQQHGPKVPLAEPMPRYLRSPHAGTGYSGLLRKSAV